MARLASQLFYNYRKIRKKVFIMINLNESSRLSNVLKKVFTDSSLKQIKEGVTALVQDKSNLPKSKNDPVFAYLFFSEKDDSIVCKSTKDVFSYSSFYKDGSRKKDNFIFLASFDIKRFLVVDDSDLDSSIELWLKESFSGSVTEELLDLQHSINSIKPGSEGRHDFSIIMSSMIPPLDLLDDQQLKIVLMDKIFSEFFIFKDSKERYTFSQEAVQRLFKVKDEIISEFLDDLRNNRNNRSFQFFLQIIMRFKTMGYLSNESFYSLLETVFNEDSEVWKDLNHFISGSNFYEEKRMLLRFSATSKKELEALINLLDAIAKTYFPVALKENLFQFSHILVEDLLYVIKRSRFLPDDFPLFGTKKEHLSMSVLYRFYCM